MSQYSITALGNSLLDTEFQVSNDLLKELSIPKGHMTLVTRQEQDKIIHFLKNKGLSPKNSYGGSAANSVVAAQQFGSTGYFNGKVGLDSEGKLFISAMEATGTAVNSTTHKSLATGRCLVLITPDAERSMLTYLGASSTLAIEDVNKKSISSSKYLYLEGYLVTSDSSFEAAKHAALQAKQHNKKIALSISDPFVAKEFNQRLMELIEVGIDTIFCNEEEAQTLTKSQDTHTAIDKIQNLANCIAITKNNQGSIVIVNKEKNIIPPFRVEAIDTTGAGDMCAGAFMYAIDHNFAPNKAGVFANFAASRMVTVVGSRLDYEYCQLILKSAANIL